MNARALKDFEGAYAESGSAPVLLALESSESRKLSGYQLSILCFDLSRSSPFTQFAICSFSVFIFYLAYGYLQELVFTVEVFKPFGWYLTMIQFLFYCIFGFLEMKLESKGPRKIPIKHYIVLSVFTVGTMGFSNASLGYLNYPTQVIFKCCKLIPVLIGGIIIQGKSFSVMDWCACLCMSCGLVFFTLADNIVSPSFHIYGLVFINIALCFDAALGNLQEKYMKQYQVTNAEMVFYSYGIGFFYIMCGLLATNQLNEAFTVCLKVPTVYFYAALFSISGYLGVNIVLSLVQMYGALVAVTVTTMRKALTIVLSFILFSKPFTIQYFWSGMIVLFSIYLNLYSKNRSTWDVKIAEALKKCQHKVMKIPRHYDYKCNVV